jgi:hypothetical protein
MRKFFEPSFGMFNIKVALYGEIEIQISGDMGFSRWTYTLSLVPKTGGQMTLLVARSDDSFITPWQIGTLYTRAGRNNDALDWLEKACEENDPNIPFISVDPIFNHLRDNPRFGELLRKMKLPQKI